MTKILLFPHGSRRGGTTVPTPPKHLVVILGQSLEARVQLARAQQEKRALYEIASRQVTPGLLAAGETFI